MRKKRGKLWMDGFVNLFFLENWVESAWKYFCEKCLKKLFETNLEKISVVVVFLVMKREYEMREMNLLKIDRCRR
jgi:hypothetical protein